MLSNIMYVVAGLCVIHGLSVIFFGIKAKDVANVVIGILLVILACLKLGGII